MGYFVTGAVCLGVGAVAGDLLGKRAIAEVKTLIGGVETRIKQVISETETRIKGYIDAKLK